MKRAVVLAAVAIGVSTAGGCARVAEEAVAVQIGPPPAAPAEVTPPREQGQAPGLSVFADGWGLDVGLVRGAQVLFDEYGDGVGVVEGDDVRVQARPFAQLLDDPAARVRAVFGGAIGAHDLWALATRGGQDLPRLYHGVGDRWTDGRAITLEGYGDVRVSAWTPGHALAFLDPKEHQGGAAVDLAGAAGGAALSLDDPAKLALEPLLRLVEVTATARGDVIALAVMDEGRTKHAVEVWRDGKAPGVVVQLPEVTTSIEQIDAEVCAGTDGALHVVRDVTVRSARDGKSNLESAAHLLSSTIGGKGWTRSDLPRSTAYYQLRSCAVAKDGSVWVAWDANQKIHPGESRVDRFAGGTWQRVPFASVPRLEGRHHFESVGGKTRVVLAPVPTKSPPAEALSVTRMVADDAGTIWVRAARLAGGARVTAAGLPGLTLERYVVLRSGPARTGGVLSWGTAVGGSLEGAMDRAARGSGDGPMPAATADCKQPWVQVEGAPLASASGHAYPGVAAVVRGRPEYAKLDFVEAKIGGRRVIGFAAVDFTTARALAERLRRARPNAAAPEVLCGAPRNTRAVKF